MVKKTQHIKYLARVKNASALLGAAYLNTYNTNNRK